MPPALILRHDEAGARTIAPLLVSEREAARLLGVSPRTVWAMANRGELPRVCIGRAVRYRLADLQIWCEQNARSATAPA